jgi:hypothetical protein
MASPAERTTVDADGVRTTRTRGAMATAVIAAGAGLIVTATAVGVRVLNMHSPPPVPRLTPTGASERGVPVEVSPSEPARFTIAEVGPDATVPRTRAGKIRALKALGVEPTKGPNGRKEYSAKEIISAMHAAGNHEGIGAFEPPGTDPPKLGLVVPDDFELPEGYIRYFQTTDDGRSLPPILMFHPDYRFVDENGQPIALPTDRVVPPELAPPGLPLRRLELPPPDAPPAGRR